ncbi:hypothetical protein GALMADRAFT_221829 [Galerina marginata CBS 339.88]|uniref:Uncharacterized protein n=1 Tax=Galerina marginata (strain CBS 339.88) TaxID=685588 RepID=A0A067TFJ8_GALM3|nr:hypothetical protein GALMADRAFT_221829 [Galerina marginata CBS 339.88]
MLTKREIPKINGSTTAFIVLVVVLVFIIIIACSATIYLLREDIAEDREALTSGARGRYHLPGSRDPSKKTSRNWLMGILRLPGSHKQSPKVRHDDPRTIPGRNKQGWFPAGNGSDWDSEGLPSQSPKPFAPSATMRMAEQDTLSLGTPRSSNVGSFPHASHIYSSPSNATSSARFDPHGIRGLSYADQSSLSVPGIISSFQSQLYSPPSSPSLSPTPDASSRVVLASPEHMERSLTNDSFAESFNTTESRPSIRTFEGGTKFIEAL